MRALLAVSNGTAARETLSGMEAALSAAFPDRMLARAFTSAFFRGRCREDGEMIDSVPEALDALLAAGCTDVAVQPLLVTEGTAYSRLQEAVSRYTGRFDRLTVGRPFLTGDCRDAARTLPADGPTVYVGHGGPGAAAYDRLEEASGANIYIAALDGFDGLVRRLRGPSFVLRPLLLTAGRHASRDISPWAARLAALGYRVQYVPEGLGEVPAVRALFVRRLREAEEARRSKTEKVPPAQ